MNRTRARHLPQWRQIASGFAVVAFALVFLCATTQLNAHQSPTGNAAAGHLGHLVVASQHPGLIFAESGDRSEASSSDGSDSLARLRASVLWLHLRTSLTGTKPAGQPVIARLDYTSPPLRAPPIA